jgi:hypothetical protein
MHRYNNQDHSMVTAMLSVENMLGAHHDVWAVNVEEDYHEEVAVTSPVETARGGARHDLESGGETLVPAAGPAGGESLATAGRTSSAAA